jgi:hypothetical protein
MQKDFNNVNNISRICFNVTKYKYKVDFKIIGITYMFTDLTWKQKMFFNWFLDGVITEIKE